MKISEQWLRKWVNPTISANAIGEQLTMAGLELDDLTKVAKDFTGVVVGEVVEVTQHPDADRLKVTKVNVGEAELLQIVCGAPNVAVGAKVPVALIGAVLPENFKIKKGKLRGVESHGMLCGASEIDLEDEVDGLLILPSDAPVGMNIRDYLALDNHILDISITPNRGDCFSIRGIARELAVINQMPFHLPFTDNTPTITNKDSQTVIVETSDCPRYYAQVVNNLNGNITSPNWIKQALIASGIRPRNLLVDVTNYVLLELGQPLHAFDADKIVGKIIVRHAKPQETLQLLNEQIIEMQGDELVIADEAGIIALAGIMGGLRTAVTDDTRRVVIESAFFKPLAIAGRARRFGLHTDASQRFERGVDFELPKLAINRAVTLLHELGSGEVGQMSIVDNVAELPQQPQIILPLENIQRLLGLNLAKETVIKILTDLEITVEEHDENLLCVPPSHRFDIAIPEDLIEEIARIYGYNNMSNQLPAFTCNFYESLPQNSMDNIKHALINAGYYEAISFSFSDSKVEQYFDSEKSAKPLALANPISADLAVMRRTLLSSLLPCVSYNLNRQQIRIRLFETGLRFVGDEITNLAQINSLALVAVGMTNPEQPTGSRLMDFYDLKHDVETVFPRHLLQNGEIYYQRSQQPFLHTGQSADIIWQDKPIGWLGQLHPQVSKALDLPTTWVAQLDLQALQMMQMGVKLIKTPSKYPQVRRDIAVLVDKNIEVQALLANIRQVGGTLLKETWLFDVYDGDMLPENKRSLAFALIWQDEQGTLADDIINNSTQNVIRMLAENYQAILRN